MALKRVETDAYESVYITSSAIAIPMPTTATDIHEQFRALAMIGATTHRLNVGIQTLST